MQITEEREGLKWNGLEIVEFFCVYICTTFLYTQSFFIKPIRYCLSVVLATCRLV
ncbi:unnamed protein product, partial [Linum tenue]